EGDRQSGDQQRPLSDPPDDLDGRRLTDGVAHPMRELRAEDQQSEHEREPMSANSAIASAANRRRTKPRLSSRSYAMFTAQITFCMAPVTLQIARRAPTLSSATPVP